MRRNNCYFNDDCSDVPFSDACNPIQMLGGMTQGRRLNSMQMPEFVMYTNNYDVQETRNQGATDHPLKNISCSVKKVQKEVQTEITGNQLPSGSEILGKGWLSGNVLKQYFDVINYGLLKEKNGHILNPLIGYLLKTLKDSDSFIAKQNLPGLKYLIIPVSNAKYVNQAGQCHWSVLAFCKNSKTFYYFDSLKTHNLEDAKIIKNKLNRVLGVDKDDPIKVCKCPDQKVGYECGIHTIFTVEYLVSDIVANKGINANCLESVSFDEMELILKRCFLAYVLQNKELLPYDKILSIMFDNFDLSITESHNKGSIIKSLGTPDVIKDYKKVSPDSTHDASKPTKKGVPDTTHDTSKQSKKGAPDKTSVASKQSRKGASNKG